MSSGICKLTAGNFCRSLPWTLIYFRGAVAPVLLIVASAWQQPEFVRWLIVAAFLSDWADGWFARRWNVVSDRLRRADCVADVLFYLCVLAVALIECREVLAPWFPYIAVILVLEALCQVTNYLRFGCATATHAYLCKAWAVSLCVASVELLADHQAGWLMRICLALGYVAYLDVLAILAILPVPAVDVPSAFHAWSQRSTAVETKAEMNLRTPNLDCVNCGNSNLDCGNSLPL